MIPCTCAGTRRDYHPDMLVQLADGRRLLAELKHLFEMATTLSQAKHAAAWHWCTAHGAALLITDLSVAHVQLMRRTIPRKQSPCSTPGWPSRHCHGLKSTRCSSAPA